MLRVSDDHRRARIARRLLLAPAHRRDDLHAGAAALTALHATEYSTIHLALHARIRALAVADVENALDQSRTLVKVMAMRRTLWAVESSLQPYVAAGPGARVAGAERRRLAKEAAGLGDEDWLADAERAVLAALDGTPLSAREVTSALPALDARFTSGRGRWAAEIPLIPRLLTILCADGAIVRGPNSSHWRQSKPTWVATSAWLGRPQRAGEAAAAPSGREDTPPPRRAGTPRGSASPPAITHQEAYAHLVRSWLAGFGPGTEDDLVWWFGATKGAIRAALAGIDAEEVELESGATAYVLAGDTDDLEHAPDREPWVALLPTLDPTTMGWRGRDFYLDPRHTPYLFDSAGNGGLTIWVDGRIVGAWGQDVTDGNRIRLLPREPLDRDTRRRLDVEVARLEDFLRGERLMNTFGDPQLRGARLA